VTTGCSLFNKTGSPELGETSPTISGITEPNSTVMKLHSFPNPAKNSITVNYTAQQNGKYLFVITGINGNVLLRK
jgi:hypothetical protein